MSCLNITREKKKKLNKNNLIALNFCFFYQKWLKGETTMQYIFLVHATLRIYIRGGGFF